jgi:hypothetical protein
MVTHVTGDFADVRGGTSNVDRAGRQWDVSQLCEYCDASHG